MGVGLTSIQERADLSTRVPEIGTEHAVGEVRLPIPRNFVVTESRTKGLTTVEADGGPASPFSVTYKVSEPQADEAAARRVLKTLHPEPVSVKDSDWIAVSQMGIQNLRAIEIVVAAPASCSAKPRNSGRTWRTAFAEDPSAGCYSAPSAFTQSNLTRRKYFDDSALVLAFQ